MAANFELLVETEDSSAVEVILAQVDEALAAIDGVAVKSQSRDTARNLSGEEIILSYVISITAGVTIEVVKSLVLSQLSKSRLTADVNTREIPPDDVQ